MQRPPHAPLMLLLITATLAGCARSDDTSASEESRAGAAVRVSVEVVDSSGIVHRRSPAAALERIAYTIDAEPRVLIDGTEGGGQPLHAIGALAFGPGGSIAIAERGEMGVRIHDPDGARLRVVGREGQGPGEFGALNGLGFRADSMFVFDSRWFRISVFDPDGEYVRQVVPEGAWGDRPRWFAFAPDAGILTISRGSRGDLVWGLHGFAGEPIQSFEDAPAPPSPKLVGIGSSGGRPPPLQLFTAQPVAGLWNGSMVVTSGDRYRLTVHDRSGQVREVWSVVDALPPRVTDDDVEAARQRALAGSDAEARPALERRWADAEPAERFPAFGASSGIIFIDPPQILETGQGELWVRAYPVDPAAGPRWWVFSEDGTLRGSVDFPPRFELHAVSDAGALGVLEDEFDVQRVAVFGVGSE